MPRDSLFLTATLRRDGSDAEHVVRVRNLSAGGMMADVGEPFEHGETIAIHVRGIGDLRGTVIWWRVNRIGIAFAKAIDPRLARKPVAAQRPAAPAAGPLRSTRRPKLFGG